MLKIKVKTIKQKDQIDDICVSYKEKNNTIGEYTALLRFTLDKLKEYPIEVDKLVKMILEKEK